MERLHILDGSGYIYRAYYGIAGPMGKGARLTTTAGMPTGALYVYARMLVRMYREIAPDRIVVVFDAPGRTFRNDLDDGYKATRREMPADLKPQMPYFSRLTEAFCWPVVRVAGVEADDVIATLVRQARAQGWEATVYSGDKDLMQLVTGGVVVVDPMRGITYDAAQVKDKFGVEPAQMRDYLALVGDASDNVSGMAGVGKKTAEKLLAEYGSVERIRAQAGEIKGKLGQAFRDPDKLMQLERSLALVTLRDDVALPEDAALESLAPRPWDGTALGALLRELEFQALLEQLGPVLGNDKARAGAQGGGGGAQGGGGGAQAGAIAAGAAAPADGAEAIPEPIIALSASALAPVVAAARQARRLAVHVEIDGARADSARVVGLAVAAPGVPAAYIPLAHRYLGAPVQMTASDVPAELGQLLADPAIGVVGHDTKSVRRHLVSLGIDVRGVVGDTMLAAYLLDPERELSLERVIADATGIELVARAGLVGKGRSKIAFEGVAVELAAAYAGTAASAVLGASEVLSQELVRADARDATRLTALMSDIELPLAQLLADIEQRGICLDVAYLRQLSDEVGADIAGIETQVYELAGGEINIGSPKQLASLLFDKLGLKSDKMKKTKTGYSTDHEVLESLAELHPIVPLIMDHRELVKLKGTYLDALPPLVSPRTGRIYTTFNQAVAATGRLSSQEPNLQNIPIRTELGKKIRRAFVAAEGKVLVSVDYSQIELRILAHLSGDPVLIKAFRDDIDVHTQTAAEVFGIPLAQVGPLERRVAKAVNYGLVYGQSEFGLARALAIPRTEARTYIARYFERLATVREFMRAMVEDARKTGGATTIMGRRRPIPDIHAKHHQRRTAAERMAQNTPVQGSAADIMKMAMLRVSERMARERFDAATLLTVHDELVFEVAPDQAQAFARAAAQEMEGAYELSVPLKADVGIGPSWAEAH